MANSVFVLLFLFVNYLNPVSIYLTLFLNVIIFLASYRERKSNKYSSRVIGTAIFLIIWVVIIMLLRSQFDQYVFGKYFRVLVSSIFIINICYSLSITSKKINESLSIIFISHLVVIGLQLLFPSLDLPIANFFQFEREQEVITDFSIRKLGLSNSYDTASLISLAGMLFFFTRYKISRNKIFLLFSFLSLVSTVSISRTGMVIGIILFLIIYINYYITSKKKEFIVPVTFFLGAIYILITIILPIIASSTDSFLSETSFNKFDNSNRDYTEGTVTGLTSGSHLNAIRDASTLDLIFGFGVDPNKIPNMQTDIGYIKIIYHVGIIGLIMILLLYWFFFRTCIHIKKRIIGDDNQVTASFLIWYTVLVLVFNYKSLELYSRGTHDLLLILFFVLVNHFVKKRNWDSDKRLEIKST